jgi:hypothetical protein
LSNLAFKNPGSKFFEPVTGKRKVKCPEQLDLGAVRLERKRKLSFNRYDIYIMVLNFMSLLDFLILLIPFLSPEIIESHEIKSHIISVEICFL